MIVDYLFNAHASRLLSTARRSQHTASKHEMPDEPCKTKPRQVQYDRITIATILRGLTALLISSSLQPQHF